MIFLDKKKNWVVEGDLLFYSEYPHYDGADCICRVVKNKEGKLCSIVELYELNGEYKLETEPTYELLTQYMGTKGFMPDMEIVDTSLLINLDLNEILYNMSEEIRK